MKSWYILNKEVLKREFVEILIRSFVYIRPNICDALSFSLSALKNFFFSLSESIFWLSLYLSDKLLYAVIHLLWEYKQKTVAPKVYKSAKITWVFFTIISHMIEQCSVIVLFRTQRSNEHMLRFLVLIAFLARMHIE